MDLPKFKDEIIAGILFVLTSIIAIKIDFFDRLFLFTRQYEQFELDEYFIVIWLFFVFVILLTLKKYIDANNRKKVLLNSLQYDLLTGLKNREAFIQEINTTQSTDYVILMNVINFKMINETLGLVKADKVLKKIAKKLSKIIKKQANSELFRVYGDEFGFIVFSDEEAHKICAKIQKEFEKYSVKFMDNRFNFNLHFAYSNTEPRFLTSMLTMEKSKKALDSSILSYNHTFYNSEQSEETLKMLKVVKDAISNDKLLPVYHSIVDNQTQEVIKYETLARIQQKNDELLSPFFFIELSKKFKLYPFITKNIIEKAFEDFKDHHCCFSINFSYIDIHNKQILDFFYAKLEEYKDAAKRLTIEILETENIDNYDELLLFRERIKEYGCSLAIDDFGSGYSNWVNILSLKPDFIKIDGSLIQNLTKNEESINLVKTIISFAKNNNIKTIAEFVSNEELFFAVKALEIDYSQGYFFSQPQKYSALN